MVIAAEQASTNPPSGTETTREFRQLRKAIKDIFLNAPDGVSKDELTRLAEMKGIRGDDFKNVVMSLINSGHLYFDERSEKFRFVRNE